MAKRLADASLRIDDRGEERVVSVIYRGPRGRQRVGPKIKFAKNDTKAAVFIADHVESVFDAYLQRPTEV